MKYYISVNQSALDEKIAEDAHTYYSEGGDRFYDFTGTAWKEMEETLLSHGYTEVTREVYEIVKASPFHRAFHDHLIYSSESPLPEDVYKDEYIRFFTDVTTTMNTILR